MGKHYLCINWSLVQWTKLFVPEKLLLPLHSMWHRVLVGGITPHIWELTHNIWCFFPFTETWGWGKSIKISDFKVTDLPSLLPKSETQSLSSFFCFSRFKESFDIQRQIQYKYEMKSSVSVLNKENWRSPEIKQKWYEEGNGNRNGEGRNDHEQVNLRGIG